MPFCSIVDKIEFDDSRTMSGDEVLFSYLAIEFFSMRGWRFGGLEREFLVGEKL